MFHTSFNSSMEDRNATGAVPFAWDRSIIRKSAVSGVHNNVAVKVTELLSGRKNGDPLMIIQSQPNKSQNAFHLLRCAILSTKSVPDFLRGPFRL